MITEKLLNRCHHFAAVSPNNMMPGRARSLSCAISRPFASSQPRVTALVSVIILGRYDDDAMFFAGLRVYIFGLVCQIRNRYRERILVYVAVGIELLCREHHRSKLMHWVRRVRL